MACFVAMISDIKMASVWFDVSLSFLSTSLSCSREESPSFRRYVSPMRYNYLAYGVLHGVQVMQPSDTVPVSIHRKRDRN